MHAEDPDDYALFRKQLAETHERLTEAHALIRDMVPHLRAPTYDCPGHLQFRRVIAGLRKRAETVTSERRDL